jgi:hypothetical protein
MRLSLLARPLRALALRYSHRPPPSFLLILLMCLPPSFPKIHSRYIPPIWSSSYSPPRSRLSARSWPVDMTPVSLSLLFFIALPTFACALRCRCYIAFHSTCIFSCTSLVRSLHSSVFAFFVITKLLLFKLLRAVYHVLLVYAMRIEYAYAMLYVRHMDRVRLVAVVLHRPRWPFRRRVVTFIISQFIRIGQIAFRNCPKSDVKEVSPLEPSPELQES